MPFPPATAGTRLSPEEILRRVRLGDPDSLAALYDRHAIAMYRTAYRLTANRPDAEDIVHDLFVGLPEALKRYEERGDLAAWLNRIVVRLSLMRLRTDRRRRTESLPAAGEITSPERSDARLERSEIQAAVMELPFALRTVFMLKQVEGYSHEDISGMLGISVGASRVRLTRAIQMLRRSLG